MTDRDLLDDLLAKLREMQEQLSMAQIEAREQSLLASRVRHLSILAAYVRNGLEQVKNSGYAPETKGEEARRGA